MVQLPSSIFHLPPSVFLHLSLRFFHILHIFGSVGFPSIQMIKSVVAHGMAFGKYSSENFGMLFYVFAYAEKCGFCVVFLQFIQNPRRYFGDGAVVKSKIYGIG